jgi:hypothetical protein
MPLCVIAQAAPYEGAAVFVRRVDAAAVGAAHGMFEPCLGADCLNLCGTELALLRALRSAILRWASHPYAGPFDLARFNPQVGGSDPPPLLLPS